MIELQLGTSTIGGRTPYLIHHIELSTSSTKARGYLIAKRAELCKKLVKLIRHWAIFGHFLYCFMS